MKVLAGVASFVAVFASVSAFAAGGNFDRTLAVSGTPVVVVGTGSGFIHVHTGSASEVRVDAKVSASNNWSFGEHGSQEDRIRQILANPPIAQNGNTVTIGPSSGDSDLFRNITIDYEVTVPAGSTLKATSGSGSIQIANVAVVSYVQTGSGDVELKEVGSAPHVGTGSGTIRAEGVRGAAGLETGSGDIELRQEAAGDVKVQTGSGSIRLHGVNGGLRVGAGSGDIEIDGDPTAEWRANTGSGSIRLGLTSGAHYTVNASTGSGSIRVTQPIVMQDSLDRQHIVGSVNGGGPTVRLSTDSGDISVH